LDLVRSVRACTFDTHCVTRRRLEDLHSEPDRWPFKERGYDPASGFLVELERHADMLRDRMSRFYLGEAEEQRRQAGLAKAGADEERKALAGELLGDRREEDDGEEPEEPEEPVADKRAKELAGGCGRAEEDAADKVPSSSNGPDRRGRRNSKLQHDGESGGEGEDLPDLDSEGESEVGSEEDAGGGFEELERFLPKGGGCRMLEDYSEPKAGARVLYRNPSGARGWLVGTLGRRTTDRERRQGWNWNVVFKKMDTGGRLVGTVPAAVRRDNYGPGGDWVAFEERSASGRVKQKRARNEGRTDVLGKTVASVEALQWSLQRQLDEVVAAVAELRGREAPEQDTGRSGC
jgi:hypothetical protein